MPAKLVSRERALSPAEIAEVWKKSDIGLFSSIVRLCILTGQRRGELAALRSEWIDHATHTITFPASITKNRRTHTVPFLNMAKPYLVVGEGLLFPARGKDTPFNGWSKAKAALDKKLENVEPFTLHDLRRSVATQWAGLGIAPHIVERMLNQVSGQISGVTAIYNRFQYIDEMRAALTLWEDRLATILKS